MSKIRLMKRTLNETMDKIYSYVDFSMTHAADLPKNAYTLDKMIRLMDRLGNPQKNYGIIHVAGTKGKGSVCAMLASALQNTGLKVGLYTSPHMIRFNERIMVNGKMISDTDLIRLTDELTADIDAHEPVSTFELTTAMAFLYFAEQKVNIAVVEVGLGGRLDTTNFVDPILTVITSISIDHTNVLGSTIEEIAREKAGIIKPGVPVISGVSNPDAEKVIYDRAKKLGSPWIDVDKRYCYVSRNWKENSQNLVIWKVEDRMLMQSYLKLQEKTVWKPIEFTVPFAGEHQKKNAAIAFAALSKLKSINHHLDMDRMLKGISETFWPCRFEKVSEKPLVFVDGAHNQDSAAKLCRLIERSFGGKCIRCIIGTSEDKQITEIVRELAVSAESFIVTKSTHPRAADPSLLADIVRQEGRPAVETGSIEEAMALLEAEPDPNTAFIVTGSLFVAAGVREWFMNRNGNLRYFEQNGD